jgi:hypothetical protein
MARIDSLHSDFLELHPAGYHRALTQIIQVASTATEFAGAL